MRALTLFFGLLLGTLPPLYGQSGAASDSQLLWEIDGPGLPAPSYLFGTLDTKDPRCFHFSDSVLLQLQSCEQLIMEYHPEELNTWLFFNMADFPLFPSLRQELGEQQAWQLDSLLRQAGREGSSALDPLELKFSLEHLSITPDNRRSLSQSEYLLALARRWGRDIKGITTVADMQEDALEHFRDLLRGEMQLLPLYSEEQQLKDYHALLDAYHKGELEFWGNYLKRIQSEGRFIGHRRGQRNEELVAMLLPLLKQAPSFVAISVNRMIGKHSFIARLRQQGYTLRLVEQQFPSEQPVPELEAVPSPYPQEIVDTSLGYRLVYPAHSLPMPPDFLLKENFSAGGVGRAEEAIMLLHMVFTMPEMPDWNIRDTATLKAMASAFSQGGIEGLQVEKYYGTEGALLRTRLEDSIDFAIKMVLKNRRFLLLMALAEEAMSAAQYEAYFESLEIFPPSFPELQQKEVPSGGYSIAIPQPVKRSYQSRPYSDAGLRHYRSRKLYSDWPYWNANFSAEYEDVAEGLVILNAKAYLDSKSGEYFGEVEGKVERTSFEFEGCPARRIQFQQDNHRYEMRFILRNHRLYKLFAAVPDQPMMQAKMEKFFNAFRFRPILHSDWQVSPLAGSALSSLVPNHRVAEKAILDADSYPYQREQRYNFQDTLSGCNLVLSDRLANPYHQFSDTAWASKLQQIRAIYEAEGWIASARDTQFWGKPALNLTLEIPKARHCRVYRLIAFNGAHYYELSYYPNSSELGSRWPAIVQSLRGKRLDDRMLYTDKREAMLKALNAPEPADRLAAARALDQTLLDKRHLPFIYELLRQPLPGDSLDGKTVRQRLLREFRYIQDERTLGFLDSLYRKAPPSEKRFLLQQLSHYHTREAYEAYFDLLFDYPQDTFDAYRYESIAEGLLDSTSLTAQFTEELLRLSQREPFSHLAYRLMYRLLVDEQPCRERIAGDLPRLQRQAEQLLELYQQYERIDSASVEDCKVVHLMYLVELLGELPPDERTATLFRQLSAADNSYMLSHLIDAMLLQGMNVPDSLFAKAAESPESWHGLLERLDFEGHLQHLPDHLFTPKSVLQAYAYAYFSEQDRPIGSFSWWDVLPYEDEGALYRLHWFLFELEGEEEAYLGVGAFEADAPLPHEPLFFDYSATPYDGYNGEAIIDELLQSWE